MAVDDNKVTAGRIIYMIVIILAIPALVLFLSGDWSWVEGWIFSIWYIILNSMTVVYLYRNDPGLLAERFRHPGTGGEKEWDKYVIMAIKLAFIAWIVIMPLDAKRFEWSDGFPAWLKALGLAGLLISAFLQFRAFTDNPFLSPLVRIQKERGHHVVSAGVYGLVRHPMYLGAILMMLGAPLFLGSVYGIVAGMIMSILLLVRIAGEEKMLAEELEGYREYQTTVRYRLIPFVW